MWAEVVDVVKVTQHLCQKQLQSSSLSCSFIITHTPTHTHAHTHSRKCLAKFSFLSILPEKLVEQIFMKILDSSPWPALFSVLFWLLLLQTITKVTFNIIFGLLLAWAALPCCSPSPVTMTAYWLLFVSLLVLKPIPTQRRANWAPDRGKLFHANSYERSSCQRSLHKHKSSRRRPGHNSNCRQATSEVERGSAG